MSLLRHFLNKLRLNERTNIGTFKKMYFILIIIKNRKKLYDKEIWRLFYVSFLEKYTSEPCLNKN